MITQIQSRILQSCQESCLLICLANSMVGLGKGILNVVIFFLGMKNISSKYLHEK